MEIEIPILKGRNVVVGVSGGIAAYKAADLTSRLVKAGARVDVVMEAVPRLAMDAPAFRIQAPDRWLRARFSEIEVDSGAQGDAEVQKKKNAALMLPDLPEHPKRKKGGEG